MDRIKQPGYITKINFIDTIRQQHPHFPLTRSNLNRFSEHIRPPLELDGVDVVIFSGLQASGKTTWASALASTYNFRLYRSDTLRLQQKEAPNQMFSIQSREQIYQMMLNSAIVCTEQKQKVVLAATFPASIYSQFAQCFIQKRIKFKKVMVLADATSTWHRIRNRYLWWKANGAHGLAPALHSHLLQSLSSCCNSKHDYFEAEQIIVNHQLLDNHYVHNPTYTQDIAQQLLGKYFKSF